MQRRSPRSSIPSRAKAKAKLRETKAERKRVYKKLDAVYTVPEDSKRPRAPPLLLRQARIVDRLTRVAVPFPELECKGNDDDCEPQTPDAYMCPKVAAWVKQILPLLNDRYWGEKLAIAGTIQGGAYLVLKPIFSLYVTIDKTQISIYSFCALEPTQFPFSVDSVGTVLDHIGHLASKFTLSFKYDEKFKTLGIPLSLRGSSKNLRTFQEVVSAPVSTKLVLTNKEAKLELRAEGDSIVQQNGVFRALISGKYSKPFLPWITSLELVSQGDIAGM